LREGLCGIRVRHIQLAAYATETLKKIQAVTEKRKLVLMVHATSVDGWQSASTFTLTSSHTVLGVWPGISQFRAAPAARNVIATARVRAYMSADVATGCRAR